MGITSCPDVVAPQVQHCFNYFNRHPMLEEVGVPPEKNKATRCMVFANVSAHQYMLDAALT